jgi:hypothetical protein
MGIYFKGDNKYNVEIDSNTNVETITAIVAEMEPVMEEVNGTMVQKMQPKVYSSINDLETAGYKLESNGGARRRRRKTAKKMSKRKLKKWCKSKKNCRTKMGRKMCKK